MRALMLSTAVLVGVGAAAPAAAGNPLEEVFVDTLKADPTFARAGSDEQLRCFARDLMSGDGLGDLVALGMAAEGGGEVDPAALSGMVRAMGRCSLFSGLMSVAMAEEGMELSPGARACIDTKAVREAESMSEVMAVALGGGGSEADAAATLGLSLMGCLDASSLKGLFESKPELLESGRKRRGGAGAAGPAGATAGRASGEASGAGSAGPPGPAERKAMERANGG